MNLSYANVTATIALFVALGGGAYAATHLPKGSVGTRQIKGSAVTTAKVKKEAITGGKIQAGSIDGSKIADHSLTGADIDAPSTPFSQVVARMTETASAPLESSDFYGDPGTLSYMQNAGEANQALASMEVEFASTCTAPRIARAFLLEDAGEPPVPTPYDIVGVGGVEGQAPSPSTYRFDFAPYFGGYASTLKMGPPAATRHTFSFQLGGANCTSGGGATVKGAAIEVIGTGR
jgi:hypothetical protein